MKQSLRIEKLASTLLRYSNDPAKLGKVFFFLLTHLFVSVNV